MTNIQKMKIEEQKKAVRSGYDMDILPTDIITYEKDTLDLLDDLNKQQSENGKDDISSDLLWQKQAGTGKYHAEGIRHYPTGELQPQMYAVFTGAGTDGIGTNRVQRYGN